MGFLHFILQVREVEAEKMALQVQKAKLEVTSDKQIAIEQVYMLHTHWCGRICANLPS
jgi:hypothetical protein